MSGGEGAGASGGRHPRDSRAPLARRYLDADVVEGYEGRRYRGGLRGIKHRLWLRALDRALDRVADAGTIVDLPCGTGFMGERLCARFDRVVACDISPAMVAKAVSRSRAHGVVADLACLPMADDTVGCALNLRFMVHFEPADRRRYLRELARVTSRYVVVNYNHRYNIKYALRRLRTALGWLPVERTSRKCSRAEVEAEAAAAGLGIVEIIAEHSVVPFTTERWLVVFEKLSYRPRPGGGGDGES